MIKKKKIIIGILGQIGDQILFTSIIPKLRERHPNDYLVFGVAEQFKEIIPILKRDPLLDDVIISTAKKRKEFDYAYPDRFYGKFTQINPETQEQTIGFDNLDKDMYDWFFIPNITWVDVMAKQCANIEFNQLKPEEKQVRLFLDKDLDGVSNVKLFDKSYICIHPFASDDNRNWCIKGWTELVKLIEKKYPQYQIIQLGLPIDKKIKGCIKVNTTLEEAMLWIKNCKALICVDSSMLHIAANWHKPTLVLQGLRPYPMTNGPKSCHPYNLNLFHICDMFRATYLQPKEVMKKLVEIKILEDNYIPINIKRRKKQ